MREKLSLTSLFLLIPIALLFSQSFQVNKYQAKDGLPNELVKAIAKDSLGFLWAATDDGLIRFDGTSYKHLTDLPSKYVKGIIKRSNGQLIAATDLGVIEVQSTPTTVSAKVLFSGSSQKSDTALWYPKSFYEDHKAQLWFSDNHAVYRVKDSQNQLERFSMPSYVQPNGFNRSFTFVEDGAGAFYAISETGHFFYFQEQENTFKELPYDPEITAINAAISSTNGHIWVSTNLGVVQFQSTNSGSLENRTFIMEGANIACFQRKDKNTIWAASWWNGGLFQIPTKSPEQYSRIATYPYTGAGQILIDGSQYWFATDNGLVLMDKQLFNPIFQQSTSAYIQHVIEHEGTIYFTDGQRVFQVNKTDGNPDTKVIHQSRQGTILRLCHTSKGLWIADTEGFISLLKAGTVVKTIDMRSYGKTIFILEKDNDENLWICQDGFLGVAFVNTKTGKTTQFPDSHFKSKIIVIRKGANGDMYFGGTTDAGYLFRYNQNTKQIENLSIPLNFPHNVDISVEDIAVEKNGSIWLASKFGLLNIKQGTLNRIELGNLTEEAVKALVVGKDGTIWFANSNGLMKYTKNNNFLFNEKNGLPSKIIGYRCILTDALNQVWVGTANGLCYSPNKQKSIKTRIPLLASLESKGEKLNLTDQTILTNNDYLKVRVVSTEYPSEFVTYEYRVLGFKPEWEDISNTKEVFLTNLPEGKYELQVRNKQQGNYIWSDPLYIPFEVTKIWYKTWWGILGSLAILVFVIWGLIRLNSTRLQYEKKKLEIVVASRTKEIVEKQNEIIAQNEELEQQRHELEATLDNLKSTQTQLIQAEKMSSIGELTAGVAHEINNPLNFVMAGTNTLNDLLQDIYEIIDKYTAAENAENDDDRQKLLQEANELKEELEFDEMRTDLEDILKDVLTGAERTVSIVNTLQAFSQADQGKVQMADLTEGINATLILLNNRMGEKVKVIKDFEELPQIRCEVGLLNQVFMNLILNALQAMDYNGTLTLLTKNLKSDIQIQITDNGKGMTEDVKKHLFEPFFTTQNPEAHSGLGLSSSKEIVEKHRGTITFSSESGIGSTFTITIPKTQESSPLEA